MRQLRTALRFISDKHLSGSIFDHKSAFLTRGNSSSVFDLREALTLPHPPTSSTFRSAADTETQAWKRRGRNSGFEGALGTHKNASFGGREGADGSSGLFSAPYGGSGRGWASALSQLSPGVFASRSQSSHWTDLPEPAGCFAASLSITGWQFNTES